MDLTLIQHQNNKISRVLIMMVRNKDKQAKIPLEKKLKKDLQNIIINIRIEIMIL